MQRRTGLMVGGMALVFTVAIGWLQWLKLHAFEYNGLDLGIYAQTIWSLAHGHGFASSIHDPSYLGDHVELWLVPLTGIYRLLPSPLTLVWVQTLVIASTAWPIWKLAGRWLGPRWSWVPVVVFLAHPLVYNTAAYEFHGLIFALPVLFWMIVWYEERRLRWWVGGLLLLLLTREDMALVGAGWGLLALIDRRSWRWWVPAWLLSALWFVVAQQVIAGHNPLDTYKYLAFYRGLGDSYGAIASFPFRHPVLFISHVFRANNLAIALGLLVSFGFLPILRPKVLWPLVFSFGQMLLLGSSPTSVLRIHYVIPYLPFLLWSSVQVIAHVRQKKLFPRRDPMLVIPLVIIFAIVGPFYTHSLYGLAEQPWHRQAPPPRSAPATLERLAALVPGDARVLTTFNLLPRLSGRSALYSLNYVYLGRRQYTESPYTVPTRVDAALIDWQQFYDYQFLYRDTLFEGRTGAQRIADALADNGLKLAAWEGSVALYTPAGTDPYVPTESVNLLPTMATAAGADPQLVGRPIIGPARPVVLGQDRWREVPVTIQWTVAQTPAMPYSLRFTSGAWSWTTILGQGTFPAVEWTPGHLWITRYRLLIPETDKSETLRLELLATEGRYRLNRWRTFGPAIQSETVVHQLDLGPLTAASERQ